MTTRMFHLGDILSVTTDALVSPDRIGGVYNILNWMTGDNLFTHQLPRAAHECRPSLLDQHPDLAAIVAPDFADEAHVWRWLAEQAAIYGETREVAPLAARDHTVIDPLTEIRMNAPHMEIVAVEVSDDHR